jgi:Nif-specific regulatory protein
MKASLVAIAGPLQGSVFALAETQFTIGRAPGNSITLDDAALSRRHCTITERDGQYELRDAESRNGTRVNGVPVTQRLLEPHDEIRAGRSLFLFVAEPETSGAISIAQSAAPANVQNTVVLSRTDAVYGRPDALVGRAGNDRTERDLRTLLRLASAIPERHGAAALQKAVLELTSGAVSASRMAFLVAQDDGAVELGEQWSEQECPEAVTVFQHVIDAALKDRTGLLFSPPAEAGAGSRPLMVVPVVAREEVIALLYFEARADDRGFSRDDLELAMGIAQFVAGPLENAFHADRLQRENQRLRAEINIQHEMVGSAPSMRDVFTFIGRAASADSTVLIRGESGTGKELVARALHRNSPRAARPFVAINCAALTESLLESELFGYEKGAFTGALNQKRGKFEEAEGGTLFLDEVGELAPPLQAKLLRVLQEREFYRVGGTRPIRTDVRVVAATNRDLEEAARDRSFRQDLYFRLNVVSVNMPSLRDRREDIPALAEHFLQKHARKVKRGVTGISPEAAACLRRYDWPGNVRELENAIERAVVLGATESIVREDLPEAVAEAGAGGSAGSGDFHDLVRQAKRRVVLEAIERAGGSITDAARLLGLHPNNLHRLIRTLDLRSELKK